MPIFRHVAFNGLLYTFDFTSLLMSDGSVTTDTTNRSRLGELVTLRASVTTAETSTATVATTIGVDSPAVGNAGFGKGFVQEKGTSQGIANQFYLSGWSTSGATLTQNQSDPTVLAGTAAVRAQVASAGFVAETSTSFLSGSNNTVASQWERATAGTNNSGMNVFRASDSTRVFDTSSLNTTWRRVWLRHTGLVASPQFSLIGVDGRNWSGSGGLAAGARDVTLFGPQREEGNYPTEFVPNGGTRANQRLYHSAASRLVTNGRLGFYLKWISKCSIGGSNDEDFDPRLWTIDANNNVSINRSTGVFTSTIAGSSYTTATGFTCSRGDVLEAYVGAGGGSRATSIWVAKNGGAWTKLSTGSPPTQNSISAPATIDIGCNGTNLSQLPGWYQNLALYADGAAPFTVTP